MAQGTCSGIRQASNGYIYVRQPDHPLAHRDGYVAQHRLVAWDAGILTDPKMHVHHIDHDKTNNDLSNLEVMSESDHHRHHIQEAGGVENQHGHWGLKVKTCEVDGCGRPTKNRDLCAAHYSRLRRWGDVRADLPIVPGQKLTESKPCASPVCDRPARVLGWCHGHYGRLKSTGDAKPDRPIGKPGRPPSGRPTR